MAKTFDATLKALLEESPADWPALAGCPAKAVQVIDADISTISGAADKVLLVGKPPDSIMHVEFQAGPDATLPRRMNVYNGVLEDRHDLPVRSVAVLLRPEANLSILNGLYQRQLPGSVEPYRTFHYQVIRVWQLPVEPLLAGGVGILPLAPISAVTEKELPDVLRRMKKRLDRGKRRSQTERLWTATYLLMGLRYELAFARALLQGVLGMEESVTYQAIIAEGARKGAIEEARKILLRQGQQQFGEPVPTWARKALEATHDLEQLEQLTERLLAVRSWEDLLPEARRRSRRSKSGS